MDQAQAEWLVRITARSSATAYVAALVAFSLHLRNHASASFGIRLFVAFIAMHTIHFGAVTWLAVVTGGQNIRTRGGWVLVLSVAAVYYLASFAILRAWNGLESSARVSRRALLAAHASIVVIALIFLNSYIARVGSMPAYWVPAIVMLAAVATYLTCMHRRVRGLTQV